MDSNSAVGALSALAHPGRLEVFRLLVKAGPGGMAAGDIARATGSLANTLSNQPDRAGRSIIYAAGYDRMRELLAFLIEDCRCGNAEICAPLAAIAATCC